ncbi:hypothetical protein ACNOYE_25765 [Nannocystaceae bacterium ST9]
MLSGNPSAVPLAAVFGALAEAFIATSVLARLGIRRNNAYLDNPLAGRIDLGYVDFIRAKNPQLSRQQRIALASTTARPDILMHQLPLLEFEEVKPDSTAGRRAGRIKVKKIDAFLARFSLAYRPGSTYTPPPPFLIGKTKIGGVPLTITFEIKRGLDGLLLYHICVETDWVLVSVLALAAVAAVILILISEGALTPVLIPLLVVEGNSPSTDGKRLATGRTEAKGTAPA